MIPSIDTIAPFRYAKGPDISDDRQYYGSYVAPLARALRRVPRNQRDDFVQAYWLEVAAMRPKHDQSRVAEGRMTCSIKGLARRHVYRARYASDPSSVPRPSTTTLYKYATDPDSVTEETKDAVRARYSSFSIDGVEGPDRFVGRDPGSYAVDSARLAEALDALRDLDREILTRRLKGEDSRAIAKDVGLSHQAISLRSIRAVEFLAARERFPGLVEEYADLKRLLPLEDEAIEALRDFTTPTPGTYTGTVFALVRRGLVAKVPKRPGYFVRTEAGDRRLALHDAGVELPKVTQ